MVSALGAPRFKARFNFSDEAVGDSEANTISLLREIPVLDINDNAPVFEGRPYSVQLTENTPPGTRVFRNVTVTDKDGGINGDVILTCFPPTDAVCTTFDVTSEKVILRFINRIGCVYLFLHQLSHTQTGKS